MRVRDVVAQWLARVTGRTAHQVVMDWEQPSDKQVSIGGPPMPVVNVGNLTSTGTIVANSATGGAPVVEASASDIKTGVNNTFYYVRTSNKQTADAAGTWTSAGTGAWVALSPADTQVQADGAGAVAAVDVIAAIAGKHLDLDIDFQVSITGAYLMDWVEDPTGGAGPTVPDYTTAPVSLYLIAGVRYHARIRGLTAAKTMGWNNMVNGSWPNSAYMTITGDKRGV